MDDAVGICNAALTLLGACKIRMLDEESDEARKCKGVFWGCVKAMLEDYKWSFATTQGELARVPEEYFGWEYAYRYPSDCLDIISIVNPQISNDWRSPVDISDYTVQTANNKDDSNVLLTVHERVILKYVFLQKNISKYSFEFRNALVRRLVITLGVDLKGMSGNDLRGHEQIYQMLISKAKAKDSKKSYIKPVRESKYRKGRR